MYVLSRRNPLYKWGMPLQIIHSSDIPVHDQKVLNFYAPRST